MKIIIAGSASFQQEPPVFMGKWAEPLEPLGHAQLHGGPEPYQNELLDQRFSQYTLLTTDCRVNRC